MVDISSHNFIDLTGQKFGRLTVIKQIENKITKTNRVYVQWLCKCDCGNMCTKISPSLKPNGSQSCGCLLKETISKLFKKYNTYDLTKEYGIGYTVKNEPYYFDLEDYDLIKNNCWYFSKDGYLYANTYINRIRGHILMHRIILNVKNYKETKLDVDHINHYTNDNRKDNLRLVTRSQNNMNKKEQSSNTSGYKGVTYIQKDDVWCAFLWVDTNYIYLGRHLNKEDAIKVRQEAEIKYFGEYEYKNCNKELNI